MIRHEPSQQYRIRCDKRTPAIFWHHGKEGQLSNGIVKTLEAPLVRNGPLQNPANGLKAAWNPRAANEIFHLPVDGLSINFFLIHSEVALPREWALPFGTRTSARKLAKCRGACQSAEWMVKQLLDLK